jgi:hypothetical protein
MDQIIIAIAFMVVLDAGFVAYFNNYLRLK